MSDTEASAEVQQFEFDQAFQRKIVNLFMRDTNFALRTRDLLQPEFFTEAAAGAVVRLLQEYVASYKSVPDKRLIPSLLRDAIAAKKIRPDLIVPVTEVVKGALTADLSSSTYVMDKVTEFARHVAMENAIMASVNHLEKKNFDAIKKAMGDALAVGAHDDTGEYDYFKEIESRTQRREDIVAGKIVKTGITTGFTGMDCYLFHNGWGRKELSCIMGGPKSGKTALMGTFTKNASLAGYSVAYYSLEVASWIIAERIDADISNTMMKDLNKDSASVEAAVRKLEAGAGPFKMRDYASGTLKPSKLHRSIEAYRADGIMFDLVTVDYADIMAAEYRNDLERENLRSIYIDLRAIAFEFDLALLTGTQTNRSGATASTAKATDVGDDFNKARTVDLMLTINSSEAEKKAGEARLHWALARNGESDFSLTIKQERDRMRFLSKILGKT